MAHLVIPLLALLACGPAPLPAGDPTRPDIVLVSVDTLRADHLSCYGHSRPTSPFVDSLAAQGTRFAHARSASPWTLPAHTTLLTGQLPGTHRVVEDSLRLDPATPVLPEALARGGYATGGFVSTLYVSRLFGFERGFQRFEDFGIDSEKENLHGDLRLDRVVDEALDWWATVPEGQPVFLFLHTYDVHYEYDPPEPWASLFDRPPQRDDPPFKTWHAHKKKPLDAAQLAHQEAQYDEAIRWVDDQLAALDARLRAAGRTVRWVVTADHGEEFGERGSWGHAHTLYAEQLHVPLVVAERRPDGRPGALPQGRVVPEAVGLHDVAPTLAAWVDGAGPLAPDGVDLGPVLAGQAPPPRPVPAETTRFKTNRLSLYRAGLRLEWDLALDQAELFAPDEDPDEARDLAPSRPQDVARLKAELLALSGEPWTAVAAGRVQVGEAGRLLRALGEGEGARVEVGARADLDAGARFQVLPVDAPVRHLGPDGAEAGPWAAAGGTRPPAGAPLALDAAGGGPAGAVLDDATRQALEALGYVQGE